MKSLKILTCSIALAVVLFLPHTPSAHSVSFQAGVYDFTEQGTQEFYSTIPSLLASYSVIDDSSFGVQLSVGASYTSFTYFNRKHTFYMLPLFITGIYKLAPHNPKFQPYLGTGFNGYISNDKNTSINSSYKSRSYGYHFLTGCKIPVKENLSALVELRYSLLIEPTLALGPVILSGINSFLGVNYEFGRK